MKADFNPLYSQAEQFLHERNAVRRLIPAHADVFLLFFRWKELIDRGSEKRGARQDIQRSGEAARNEKSEMNYASLSHIHLFPHYAEPSEG